MAFSIDALIKPQSSADIRATMVSALVALGVPANLWRAGGVASTMLTVVAITLAGLSALLANAISAYFLPLATGSGLVLLAKAMYGVDAPAATFATGVVTLTNAGGGSYVQAAGTLTFLNPSTKVTYTNVNAVTVAPLATVTGVQIQATIVGSVGNANPAAVNTIVTSMLGVTVTNPASVVGNDAISDVALRQLCLDSLGVNSPYGPRSAYAYAIQTATNATTGAPVNVNRWSISPASSTGIVTIVIASPAGPPNAGDLAGVEASVEAHARPDTVTVDYFTATAKTYNPTIQVWAVVPSGVLSTAVHDACETVLTTLCENYPIGGETASDDSHPGGFTGFFGPSAIGAIASGVVSLGGTLISVKGATDMTLAATEVPINGATLSISLLGSS